MSLTNFSTTNVLYTITYVPVTDSNGPATIQLVAAEGSLKTTNVLALTITPVDQPPTNTLSTNYLTNSVTGGGGE